MFGLNYNFSIANNISNKVQQCIIFQSSGKSIKSRAMPELQNTCGLRHTSADNLV